MQESERNTLASLWPKIVPTIQMPELDNAGFNLQTAPAVTGPFTNLNGAISPYTNVTTSTQQFFRLIGNRR